MGGAFSSIMVGLSEVPDFASMKFGKLLRLAQEDFGLADDDADDMEREELLAWLANCPAAQPVQCPSELAFQEHTARARLNEADLEHFSEDMEWGDVGPLMTIQGKFCTHQGLNDKRK